MVFKNHNLDLKYSANIISYHDFEFYLENVVEVWFDLEIYGSFPFLQAQTTIMYGYNINKISFVQNGWVFYQKNGNSISVVDESLSEKDIHYFIDDRSLYINKPIDIVMDTNLTQCVPLKAVNLHLLNIASS